MASNPPGPRILIVRLSALGDVLHCLPALEALRRSWPDAEIDWVCEPLGADLLDGHPSLRRVLRLPRPAWARSLRRPSRWGSLWRDVRAFRRELRRERYDLVIDFQGNLRSQWIARWARGDRKIGAHRSEVKEFGWLFRFDRPRDPAGHVNRVEKYLHLVEFAGASKSPIPARFADLTDDWKGLDTAPPDGIALHPFVSAFGRFKEWPAELYSQLARHLAESHGAVWITFGPDEEDAAREIVAAADHPEVRLAPTTRSPRQLAAFISRCRLVIAADTGPLHLAAALGVPVVGLYGPKDPVVYGPWSERARVVQSRVPCAPCRLRRCEHAVCMQMITSKEVERTATELLRAGISGHPMDLERGDAPA